jgi:hypothetical protein
MAAANTYTPIATATLSSNGYFTFSSIPSTYTDLVLVLNAGFTLTTASVIIQFNGDGGSNYSQTWMRGTGSATASGRVSNGTFVYLDYSGGSVASTINRVYTANIINYANTNVYKNLIFSAGSATDWREQHLGSWRSTAAINSIVVSTNGGSIVAGSTLSLYGILAA